MAMGEVVLLPQAHSPVGTNPALPGMRNYHPLLSFAAGATDQEAQWTFYLPAAYAGGGITVDIIWATVNTTGGGRWQTSFEAMVAQSVASDGYAAANSGAATPSGTTLIPVVTSIAHTDGAEIDSLAAGQLGRFKLRRDADDTTGTDDLATAMEVLAVILRET